MRGGRVGPFFVIRVEGVKVFQRHYYACRASTRRRKQGAAALSSPAHLLTYTFSRRRAVYFHINKAHPFKFGGRGGEFNLEAGLSVISSYYLPRRWWRWWWLLGGPEKKKIQLSQLQPAHYFCYI